MKQNESIHKIMSTDLVTATPSHKFSEIKEIMESNGIRHLPIVEGRKLIGIISRLDILKASFSSAFVTENEADPMLDHTLKITDLMTQDVITLKDTDTVKHAVRVMTQHSFHSLPVINDRDELVGIISTADLLQYLLDQY